MHYRPLVADRWFSPRVQSEALSNSTTGMGTTGMLWIYPLFFVNGTPTISNMGVLKSTTHNQTDKFQLGLYNSDGGGLVGTLVHDYGEVTLATSSTGIITGTASNQELSGDTLYWVAIKLNAWAAGVTHCSILRADNVYLRGWDPWEHPYGQAAGSFPTTGNSNLPTVSVVMKSTGHGTGAMPSDLTGTSWTYATDGSGELWPKPVYAATVAEIVASTGNDGWGWGQGGGQMWQVVM